MNLEKTLQKYGLSEKQAKIYLACLELGSASVYKISQKAELPRSTCYEILDSLREYGLVTTHMRKKVRYYNAESPKKAVGLAKEKAEILEQALPQLVAMYGHAKDKPKVRFYQGRKNVKTVLSEMLEAREICGFASPDDLFEVFGKEHRWFLEKRIQKRIPVKIVAWDSPISRQRRQIGPDELRETRIMPSQYKHQGSCLIYDNRVAMFLYDKDQLMALVIESKGLAEMQKQIFNFAWDSIEK